MAPELLYARSYKDGSLAAIFLAPTKAGRQMLVSICPPGAYDQWGYVEEVDLPLEVDEDDFSEEAEAVRAIEKFRSEMASPRTHGGDETWREEELERELWSQTSLLLRSSGDYERFHLGKADPSRLEEYEGELELLDENGQPVICAGLEEMVWYAAHRLECPQEELGRMLAERWGLRLREGIGLA